MACMVMYIHSGERWVGIQVAVWVSVSNINRGVVSRKGGDKNGRINSKRK